MTKSGDVIQLHPDLLTQWHLIRKHYRRIGLSHTENAIWDVSHDRLTEHPDHQLSVFFFGRGEQHIETFPYPCYLKAAVSVSGVSVYRSW